MKSPAGCLLITPESLEALLLRHGHGLAGLLAGLQYVVVDELHAFMGTERGKQLQSLLHRIEKALGQPGLPHRSVRHARGHGGAAEYSAAGRGAIEVILIVEQGGGPGA